MSQFRIAICDDEKSTREYETSLLKKWATQSGISSIIDSFSSAENFLFESEDKIEYDLLLLDIQMGKMSGVELARVLRSRGFSGSLVFLTGIKDYAIEGYEVGAVRYLLKPIKETDFFDVMDLVHTEFARRGKQVFLLQMGSEVYKIPFDDIIYVEASGHYVRLVTVQFEKEWKANFGTVSSTFEEHGFFCLKRGLLVNLQHIQKITKTECILDSGEILPVARNNYDSLNQAFIKFYMEKNV